MSDLWKIHQGDSLQVLRSLPGGSIDAVVTDPPYAVTSEASSSVSRSQRSTREMQFFEAWLREHLAEWIRVLRPTGAIWMTIDWRGAMALDEACAKLNLREPKVGVWDRDCIGMGHVLRNQYECFAIVALEKWQRQRADEPDVWRHRWTQGGRESDHKAEKPVDLMRRACRYVAQPGATILDPFCGSGSTGKAALIEGFRFIGIEREERHIDAIHRRLSAVEQGGTQGDIFTAAAGVES
jgi:site-specific DNA-methyltransferase (adenine-specific)